MHELTYSTENISGTCEKGILRYILKMYFVRKLSSHKLLESESVFWETQLYASLIPIPL